MTDATQVQPAPKRKPPAAGMGRVKGSTNKVPREVKQMILQALDKAGGVSYLERCARDPKTAPAFLALVGKVLPLQVTGPGGGPVQHIAMTLDEFQRVAAEVAART